MFVTKLGYYPIVLGIPWLKQHDVAIHFASNLMTFGSQYYLAHCNNRAVMVRGTSEQPPEHLTRNAAPLSIAMIGPIPLSQHPNEIDSKSMLFQYTKSIRPWTMGRMNTRSLTLYPWNIISSSLCSLKQKPINYHHTAYMITVSH
jgi:hypothetical protein